MILSSVLFLYRTFNHFEYFTTERMYAIVHYCGENLNKIYSIFVIQVSLGKLTNFSFIESSRHALSSTQKHQGKNTSTAHLRARTALSTFSSFSSQHSHQTLFIIRRDRAHWADHFILKKYGLILLVRWVRSMRRFWGARHRNFEHGKGPLKRNARGQKESHL